MKGANLSESGPGANSNPPSGTELKNINASATLRKISTAIAAGNRPKVTELTSKPPTANAALSTQASKSLIEELTTPKVVTPMSRKMTRNLTPKTFISTGSPSTPRTPKTRPNFLKPRFPSCVKKPFEVSVGTMMGTLYSFQVSSETTLSQLKYRLQDDENVPYESQVLLLNGTECKYDFVTMQSLGVREGSKFTLILKMSGGPGLPLRMPLPAEEENVVFLLCKQNDEVFMLEVHMDPLKGCKTTAKHIITLAEGSPGAELLKSLNSNECVDLGDLGDFLMDDDEGLEGYDDPFAMLEQEMNGLSLESGRPMTGDSIMSTDTFVSFLSPESREKNKEESYLSDLEWKPPLTLPKMNPVFQIQSSRRIRSCKRGVRPATAISIMRLPAGTQSMLIIPKSRPASAEKVIQSLTGSAQALISAPLTASSITSLVRKFTGSLETDIPTLEIDFEPILSRESDIHEFDSFKTFQSNDAKNDKATVKKRPRSRAVGIQRTRSEMDHSLTSSTSMMSLHSIQSSLASPLKRKPLIKTPSVLSTKAVRSESSMSHSKQVKKPARVSSGKPSRVDERVPSKCHLCQKKIRIAASFKCKCNQTFCGTHRYSDRHSCSFDYKTQGKKELMKSNPVVQKEKLSRV